MKIMEKKRENLLSEIDFVGIISLRIRRQTMIKLKTEKFVREILEEIFLLENWVQNWIQKFPEQTSNEDIADKRFDRHILSEGGGPALHKTVEEFPCGWFFFLFFSAQCVIKRGISHNGEETHVIIYSMI